MHYRSSRAENRVAWLSFAGDRDDVVVRQFRDNQWGALQWVPGNSGDNWLPQVGCDARNRVWVVWSQQVADNWDIYARSFDPARQEWSGLTGSRPLRSIRTGPFGSPTIAIATATTTFS
jgi:hypothetical protein